MPKKILCLGAVLATVTLLLLRVPEAPQTLPGTREPERKLISIWTVSSIGGGQAWLQKALSVYEKRNPGTLTYLRSVRAEEWNAESTARPDLIVYMPGDFTDGEGFAPVSGQLRVEEALLRCGRWRGEQLGVPLCWGAYVLAIGGELEPENAATPSPTTLFGRSSQTPDPVSTQAPDYPYQAASQAREPLQCARGAAMFALGLTLERARMAALPESFGTLDQTQVYARFASGACASAVLTTGQAMALDGRILAGESSACRYMVADEIVTDQVWLASLSQGADESAAELLAWLLSEDAQRLLSQQGLHPVDSGLRLYGSGVPAQVERAADHGLTAVNAYIGRGETAQAAWQFFQEASTLSEALLPIL